LRKNPSVSIEVMRVVDSRWECVIASGIAREVSDAHEASAVISQLLTKYSDQIGSPLSGGARKPMPEAGIIVAVELSEMSGRSSGSWFSIPTRPGRL
jgi:nitroimidazol reductase NimA-like FMN-containing flavoprotein (pyridoxamine 5'-phosphate oxidase superfamily)